MKENKPMTLERLKSIRGDAVKILDTFYNMTLYGTVNFEGVFASNYDLYMFEDYGKTWLAYELNLSLKEE